ncbi:hypothetical protein GGR98_003581 [Parageobacillus caldoxylosilyticus]|nr:hypothetical protein [Parageobacillus caldoxylosilyticus]
MLLIHDVIHKMIYDFGKRPDMKVQNNRQSNR